MNAEDSPQNHGSKRLTRVLAFIPPALTVLGILLHPTQVTVRQWADLLTSTVGFGEGLASVVPSVHVTLSDLCFLAGFLLWLPLRWLEGGLGRRVRSYPAPLLALFLVGTISMLPFLKSAPAWATPPVMEASRGAKQFIQFFLAVFPV